MSFQERQKTKNHSDQQGNHLKASVRYLVYSRLSGLQPGGVVVVTSSFSDSIVFAVHTRKTAFSNRSTVESVFETIRFRTVVVWTVAVSGTKQYRFRLKTTTDRCSKWHQSSTRGKIASANARDILSNLRYHFDECFDFDLSGEQDSVYSYSY